MFPEQYYNVPQVVKPESKDIYVYEIVMSIGPNSAMVHSAALSSRV